jgi:excisionase family DNA binding protein
VSTVDVRRVTEQEMNGAADVDDVAPRPDADDAELLLDVKTAAKLLAISPDHLRRLSLSGQAPQPMRLGRAVRYRRAELEQWVAAGCPRVALCTVRVARSGRFF